MDGAQSVRPYGEVVVCTPQEVGLRLLARGLTEEEAGRTLHIAASTVHTHTIHIYDKIGGRTRAALALYAMEHGLRR